MNSYESEVHKLFVRKIKEARTKQADDLAKGSVLNMNDIYATALGYSRAKGYREALDHTIAWLEEIESDLMKA